MGSEYTTLRMPPAEVVFLARLDWNIIARRVFIDPVNGLIGLMSPSSDHEIHARATDRLMNAIADRVGLGAVGLGASRWYGPGGPEERKETERQMQAFARARNLEGMTEEELGFEMIRTALRAGGLPEDGWLRRPVPTAQEPGKEVRWITESPDMDLDDRARRYLAASVAQVDNVFQLTRRFLSALERPIDTASGRWQQVWYGYAPYRPDMVQKYLDVFRAVNNFVHTGVDGATPAMRLGFTDRPLAYADILWPGEKIPTPKKVRRKGRALRL